MSEVIRYDHEFALSEAVKAFLIAELSAEVQATHNVVAWFDPAAWEQGQNRIVALCVDGSSQQVNLPNGDMVLEVGVKTVFAQASALESYTLHRTVTDIVRAALTKPTDTLVDALNAVAEKGFKIYYCANKRDWSSDANGSNIYSSVKFEVKCVSVREEE